MAKYELDDDVTFYFVVDKDVDRIGGREIRAWSDDKRLAEFYLQVHGRKSFVIRKVTQRFDQMVKILNQYPNDSLSIAKIITRKDNCNTKKYAADMTESIGIPVTTAEIEHVKDMVSTHCSSLVNYADISTMLPMFKKKYVKAFQVLGLMDIIRCEIQNSQAPSPFADDILFDELMLLIKFFPDTFD